jgi:hypothetical protein
VKGVKADSPSYFIRHSTLLPPRKKKSTLFSYPKIINFSHFYSDYNDNVLHSLSISCELRFNRKLKFFFLFMVASLSSLFTFLLETLTRELKEIRASGAREPFALSFFHSVSGQ